MQQFTGAVGSIVGKARKLAHLDASADTRRQVFSEEFGHHPPYQEASTAERESFARDVVGPVLTQRAEALRRAEQAVNDPSGSTAADQELRKTTEEFERAYKVATEMGLAEKGRTYRDYLGHNAD